MTRPNRPFRPLRLFLIALFTTAIVTAAIVFWMNHAKINAMDLGSPMPGASHDGALPPLTDAEKDLSRRLMAHVEMLGTTIGERNVWKSTKLEAAAAYI